MLTLITVNFNNAPATLRLIRCLEQQTDPSFTLMVVDNDSSPEDRELLGAHIATSPLAIDFIQSSSNRGFGGGNNLALRKALSQDARWILLINNDTEVDEHFIQQLREQLPTEPAVLGIPLNEGSRTARGGIIKWLRPTLTHIYAGHSHVNAYVIGAGACIHRDVFKRIGLIDEQYFLYFEDADFSLRAMEQGIPVRYIASPIISHRESESTKKLGHPTLIRYHARNALRFNWLRGPWWIRLLVPFAMCYGIALQTLKILLAQHPEESSATLSGILDFIRGRWGRIPTEPRIGIECESLEDTSWGVARMIRGYLQEVTRDGEIHPFHLDLYFKHRIPNEPWARHPSVTCHIVRAPEWVPLPISFSLYYYLLLPLRLWLDRPSIMYWPNYMLPLIAPSPSVVMLTEDVWHEMRNPRRAWRYRIGYSIFCRWAARHATRIMAISTASARAISKLFSIPRERISVNYLGIDTPAEGAAHDGPYVLYVGQALERRHLRETILAFTSIARNYPELKLCVIGPDKYEPPIIDSLIANSNTSIGREAIIHESFVSDDILKRYYRGAKAIVYVSEVEAFGLPPMEGLSYEVVPIIANTDLNRELYEDCACFVERPTVPLIAEALQKSISDEAFRARIKARAHSITSRYTWRMHAQRLHDLFNSLLT